MEYVSTRGSAPALDFEGVTLAGLANDGGLYLPREWPRLSHEEIAALAGLPYPVLAARIMQPFVGGRLSPNGETQGADDPDPAETFGAAAKVAQDRKVAFLELRQPGPNGTFGATDVPQQDAHIRGIYTGPLVLNSDYTPEEAASDVESGRADAISFGRPFISNPDLPTRIAKGAHLAENVNVPQSWYLPGEAGYIDYPTLEEAAAARACPGAPRAGAMICERAALFGVVRSILRPILRGIAILAGIRAVFTIFAAALGRLRLDHRDRQHRVGDRAAQHFTLWPGLFGIVRLGGILAIPARGEQQRACTNGENPAGHDASCCSSAARNAGA